MWNNERPVRAEGSSQLKSRLPLLLLGIAALGVFAWLSVQVYLSKRDPESFRAWDGPYAWIIGPPASSLFAAAEDHIRQGLEVLNDTTRPGPDRMRVYREHLGAAERLLVRSLRANPAQANALAQLAAIRWELDPPAAEEEVQKHLEMIALASRMAPRVPRIQIRLGELLLRMGRRAEALDYIHRTLELSPTYAPRVVGVLRENFLSPTEILVALPKRPETLVALGEAFFEEGLAGEYLEEVEQLDDFSTPGIIRAYGTACIRAQHPERLRDRMTEIGSLEDDEVEAERLIQRSRAHLELKNFEDALRDAKGASAKLPQRPSVSDHLGSVALRVGDVELAVRSFREALGKVARTGGNPHTRARLYRRIGQAEEHRNRPDRAYDAYKKALALNPEEPVARRRVAEMEAAAGTGAVPQ